MARGKDAVEPLAGLVVLHVVGQYIFTARHIGQTLDESMQALKALVIFMGVLIVIMMGVVGYGVVTRFGDLVDCEDAAGPALPVGAPVMAGAWQNNLRVAVPPGARVAETVMLDGRMVVRLVLPDDSQRYLVFDLDTGEQLGTIDLEPEGQ